MGVMEPLLIQQPPMVLTPCPITLEGQTFLQVEIRDGETLGQMLDRTVDLGADAWEVKIGGVVVPVEMWDRVKPKHGHVIEVRGAVNRQALMIVAMIALTYFTMGAGAGWIAGTFGVAAGGMAATMIGVGLFMAGSMLINKVLGPKPPKASSQDRESVYNIAGARNAIRPYEPLGLLFGSTRIAPDILSQPYSWYEGNDQYLGMVLTPGINVDRFDELFIGDTPIADYEGVNVWTSGFPGMPEQAIPLYSNADTIAGGELNKDATWVTRTTPADTVRVMVNLEYMLGDVTSKGKPYYNRETVQVEYRPAGEGPWQLLLTRLFANNTYDTRRATLGVDIPRGQHDIRVRRLGNAFEEKNGKASFQFTTLTAVQADDADYRGIPRIGVKILATGQLNGTPDQIRGVFHAGDMPVWTGGAWGTATDRASGLSNPGAMILAYARGFDDEDGALIAGMGLPDSMIDIPALRAFMLHCHANGYTYDHWQQSVRSHQEMLDAIALAGFGQVTWSGGRLSVVWAADGQPLTGVVNMATMKKGQFQVDYTLAGGADGVEYTYFDRTDWETKTLRVPAPGVVTMLNPARLTGEGITDEDHAAENARYHLAQHLYQYKDISYSTDLEHLSYRRLSRLALQHDMTKWGHGGRLVSASEDAGVVTVTLDEPVPAGGTAYVGLRIPGELVCRVFEVEPFTGESDTLTLVDPWPNDATFPGEGAGNPAHDTLWMYDFHSTPGYSVRVVSIEPESGLKGARVAVVPEGPEFWTYVKTGEYQPPVVLPPGRSKPHAHNLVISERQVIQGDTEYTELVATFDVTGHVSHSVVYAALMPEGELAEVAQTSTRTAAWRIEEPGQYAVVVRPFDTEGNVGEPVSGSYITERADTAPPAFDIFDVAELPGGVRKYIWGYMTDTTQPANLAGAEVRYVAGDHAAPVWEDMTPLGDEDGYFTSSFEMVVPEAGEWTFSIRARNTSGVLSVDATTITRTLQFNLGEVVDGLQQAIDQEVADRIAEDLRVATDAAADATAKANAALATAQSAVDALAAEIGEIVNAPLWDAGESYLAGWLVRWDDALYRALVDTTGEQPDLFPAVWELIGEYASLGDAVAAALTLATQTADDLQAQVTRINALYARMPTGNGTLASEAMVASEVNALATTISAEADRIDIIVARLPAGTGILASEAMVASQVQVLVNADTALSQRLDVVSASVGQATSIVRKGTFEDGELGLWAGANSENVAVGTHPSATRALRITGVAYEGSGEQAVPAKPGDIVDVSADVSTGGSAGDATVLVHWLNAAGGNAGFSTVITAPGGQGGWQLGLSGSTSAAPAGTVAARMGLNRGTSGGVNFVNIRAEIRSAAARANAQVLQQHTTEIAQVSGNLQATAEALALVQARMPGGTGTLATNAQIVAEQTARASAVGAVASDLTGLTATVGDQSASLTQLSKVSGSIPAVIVLDPSFEVQDGSWTLGPNTVYTFSGSAARTGTYYLDLNPGTGTRTTTNGGRFRVEAGQQIRLWMWLRWASSAPTGGAGTTMGLRFFDEAGADISANQIISGVPNASLTTTFAKFGGIVTVPAGAAYASLLVAGRHTAGRVLIDDVGGEFVTAGEARFLASHTVVLDVNDNISGTVSENDGVTSKFSILATIFRVISSGTVGLEWMDGYLRAYAGAIQLIFGINFGAASNLCFWYGPNVGANNCTKSNGTIWFDNAGSAYFGGSLSAGVLKNAAQSTQVSGTVTVETGTFATNGNQKVVIGSLTYGQNALSPTTPWPGLPSPQAVSARLRVQRSYNGGAWTTIATQTITGTRSYEAEGGGYRGFITLNGSVTLTDTQAGTANFAYRTVVDQPVNWPVALGSSPGTQNTSIMSVEE